ADAHHRMGQRLAGHRIGVGADVRFGDQVADRVVREALGERRVRETGGQRGSGDLRRITPSAPARLRADEESWSRRTAPCLPYAATGTMQSEPRVDIK